MWKVMMMLIIMMLMMMMMMMMMMMNTVLGVDSQVSSLVFIVIVPCRL